MGVISKSFKRYWKGSVRPTKTFSPSLEETSSSKARGDFDKAKQEQESVQESASTSSTRRVEVASDGLLSEMKWVVTLSDQDLGHEVQQEMVNVMTYSEDRNFEIVINDEDKSHDDGISLDPNVTVITGEQVVAVLEEDVERKPEEVVKFDRNDQGEGKMEGGDDIIDSIIAVESVEENEGQEQEEDATDKENEDRLEDELGHDDDGDKEDDGSENRSDDDDLPRNSTQTPTSKESLVSSSSSNSTSSQTYSTYSASPSFESYWRHHKMESVWEDMTLRSNIPTFVETFQEDDSSFPFCQLAIPEILSLQPYQQVMSQMVQSAPTIKLPSHEDIHMVRPVTPLLGTTTRTLEVESTESVTLESSVNDATTIESIPEWELSPKSVVHIANLQSTVAASKSSLSAQKETCQPPIQEENDKVLDWKGEHDEKQNVVGSTITFRFRIL